MHFGFLALDYPSAESGGGVGSQIRVLARTLVQSGHRASVVALQERGLPPEAVDEGVDVYRVAPGNLHWYLSRIPGMNSLLVTAVRELEYSRAIWAAVRNIQKRRPFDLLEGTETGSFCTALWERHVPLVIRLHGDPFTFYKHTPGMRVTAALRLSRMIQRIALRHSRMLISPSHSHLKEISAELHGVHPPIEVIPNTVSAAGSVPAEPPQRAPLVLYVGRIEKCKGIPTLLEAADQIRRSVPDCRFALAGARHSTLPQQELDELLERFGVRDCVKFLGHIPHDQLAAWYGRASVCVVPSHYETFGLAALEAMKFGVPVVAASAGSLPEVVAGGAAGLLFPPGDAQALAEAVTHVLTNPQQRDQLTRGGLRRAAQFFVDRQAPRNLELYQRATPLDLHAAPSSEHIFFSAHPDDAVLSCGGFIGSLTRQQRNVRVITVFAGTGAGRESAYAGHLRAKWGIAAQRKAEDLAALHALGVDRIDQWNFLDAPWRTASTGRPLYASYQELCGDVAGEDSAIGDALSSFIDAALKFSQAAIFYFPLSIGGHVDHRHLFRAGIRLRAAGRQVRFYEDWPYAESYSAAPQSEWFSRTVPIDPAYKLDAIQRYESQMPGLGGKSEELRNRIERFTKRRGVRHNAERYWELSSAAAADLQASPAPLAPPFQPSQASPRIRDIAGFLKTLSWQELASFLPMGQGLCLDVGCGDGRHKGAIEKSGYRWLGLEYQAANATGDYLRADAQALPIASGSAAAVVAWQVAEYLERPDLLFSEAARALDHGGVFCGSVSFLEPVHGRTYWGINPLGLETLLRKNGFKDIRVSPGLSGLSLGAWTWARRFAGNWAGPWALAASKVLQVPPMAARFLSSWAAYKLGIGSGHGMRWVSRQAPLEFAGHLVFVARKAARPSA